MKKNKIIDNITINNITSIIKKHKYTIIGLLIALYIVTIFQSNSREYNYNKLIKKAVEVDNNFSLVCNQAKYKEQYSPNTISCSIRIGFNDYEKATVENINGFLEYFILDYKNTDKLKLKKAWYTDHTNNKKDYYIYTETNNRIIVENKDKTVGKKLFYKTNSDGKEKIDFRDCQKNNSLCEDSALDFIMHLEFEILDESDTITVDNINTIYSYSCNYDLYTYRKKCANEKTSNLKKDVKLDRVTILDRNDNNIIEDLFSEDLVESLQYVKSGENILDDIKNRIIITNNNLSCEKSITNDNGEQVCYISLEVYKEIFNKLFIEKYSFQETYFREPSNILNKCEEYPSLKNQGYVCYINKKGNPLLRTEIDSHTYYNKTEQIAGKYKKLNNSYEVLYNGEYNIMYEIEDENKYLSYIYIYNDNK